MDSSVWTTPQPTLCQAVRNLFTRGTPLKKRLIAFVRLSYPIITLPAVALFLLYDRDIQPEYGMTWWRRLGLAYRFYRNTRRVFTGCSYRAHLVMAARLLEIPSSTKGAVVECGAYLGGTTTNLSIICDIVGRDLIVYDSFAGLPPQQSNDAYATDDTTGFLCGDLATVRQNVATYGAIDRCTFRPGWFSDSLPKHTEPVVLAFLDVDFQASVHDCIVNLWPHLTPTGYFFSDDYAHLELAAVFFSEHFWSTYLNCDPPGLIGAGSGVGVGQYWVGPLSGIGHNPTYPLQNLESTAYTRKDYSGAWRYRPE